MKGILDRTLEWATILTFAAMMIVVTIQILTRFLPFSFIWTEELTRFLFIYSIAFSAPLAIKKKEYINVDFLINLLPGKVKRVYETVIYLLLIVFFVVLLYPAYQFYQLAIGQRSATMALEMTLIHASIGVAFLFMVIYLFFYVKDLFRNKED